MRGGILNSSNSHLVTGLQSNSPSLATEVAEGLQHGFDREKACCQT